ncbi:unnamed protein product [Rotaria sp. Silwood1]|nr:unnamed protein product [Rotaria sp. Silwood1]
MLGEQLNNEESRGLLSAIDKMRELLHGERVTLPEIVVVGDQSVGKSSVLEAISGIELPRAQNICTRCPLELRMKTAQDTEYATIRSSVGSAKEKRIDDLSNITNEVVRLTSEIAGNVSWEHVLQNGSISGAPSYIGQIDASHSTPLTTTAENVTGNVDLRRQSIRHLSGMIKCTPPETERITDSVILDLKPRLAAKYIPGIPAYILFMCIRYIDFVDDEAHVAGFLSAVTKKIKKVPRRNEDIDYPILWTTNTVRFLHILQQYSGEEKYQATNTPKQNEQALRNFDLTDYRTIFADLVVHLYDEILKRIKAKLLPMIIPAIIEHEDLESGSIVSINSMTSASMSNDKRSKFSAQDLLKQVLNFLIRKILLNSI